MKPVKISNIINKHSFIRRFLIIVSLFLTAFHFLCAPLVTREKTFCVSATEDVVFRYAQVAHNVLQAYQASNSDGMSILSFETTSLGTFAVIEGYCSGGTEVFPSLITFKTVDGTSNLQEWTQDTTLYVQQSDLEEVLPPNLSYPYTLFDSTVGCLLQTSVPVEHIVYGDETPPTKLLYNSRYLCQVAAIWMSELFFLMVCLAARLRLFPNKLQTSSVAQARPLFAPSELFEGGKRADKIIRSVDNLLYCNAFYMYMFVSAFFALDVWLMILLPIGFVLTILLGRKKARHQRALCYDTLQLTQRFCTQQAMFDDREHPKTRYSARNLIHQDTYAQMAESLLWLGHPAEADGIMESLIQAYPSYLRQNNYHRYLFWKAYLNHEHEQMKQAVEQLYQSTKNTRKPFGDRKLEQWAWNQTEIDLLTLLVDGQWEALLEKTVKVNSWKNSKQAWMWVYRYLAARELEQTAIQEEAAEVLRLSAPEIFERLSVEALD